MGFNQLTEAKCCTGCSQVKSLEGFSRNSSSSDGRMSRCRPCESVRVREWRLANLEHVTGRQRTEREKLRAEVLGHYGRQCACCGSTDRLQIDYVNGDGGKHRRELFGKPQAGRRFYLWLVRSDFPGGFQTLCFPCNRSKGTGARCTLVHVAPPGKPVLRPLARLDVEQARQFLMELDDRTPGADPMFLLGRLAEHAQALLDVIDATVTP